MMIVYKCPAFTYKGTIAVVGAPLREGKNRARRWPVL